jgi:hypothetical protein
MIRLLRRLWRWLGFGDGPAPPDPYASKLAPVRPRAPRRSGAVALDEPDE